MSMKGAALAESSVSSKIDNEKTQTLALTSFSFRCDIMIAIPHFISFLILSFRILILLDSNLAQ